MIQRHGLADPRDFAERHCFVAIAAKADHAVVHALGEMAQPRDESRQLMQTLFLMQTMDLPALTFPGTAATTINVDMGKALVDLSLELYRTREGLNGCFEYRTQFFSAVTISHLAAYLERSGTPSALAESPSHMLADLLYCLDAGLDTFMEKPPGITLFQAESLCRKAAESQRILQVGFNRRHIPLDGVGEP